MITAAVDAGARRERACEVVGLADRTVERWRAAETGDDGRAGPRTCPANAFTAAERAKVLAVVNSPEYRDLPPKQVVPRLADEGRYIGSESTIYRIIRAEGQAAHRGRAKPRTVRSVDEHEATAANEVRSWELTYLLSTQRGRFFYLYLIEHIADMMNDEELRAIFPDPHDRFEELLNFFFFGFNECYKKMEADS
jgi:hypothetical protein